MLKGGLTGESSGASAGGASGCSCYYFSNLCLALEKCFRNFYHTYITPIFLGVSPLAAGVRGLSGAITMERSEHEKLKYPDRINLDRKGLHGKSQREKINWIETENITRLRSIPQRFQSWLMSLALDF